MNKFRLVLCGAFIVSLPILMSVNNDNLHAQDSSQSQAEPTEVPKLPAAPEDCVYLKEISTGETEIRKKVKLGNQNTDFAVPSESNFTYYIPQVLGENNAEYEVKVYFKYSDGSNASVFEKTLPLKRFKRVSDRFNSPSEKEPYQVNFNVGSARNNAYRVSVLGCQ